MIRNESVVFKVLRNGADYALLYPDAGSAPTLRASNSGEIKMSLQGTFMAQAFDTSGNPVEVDWLNDEIEPVLILDGVETPLGILIPTTREFKHKKAGKVINLQAYDRCWRVQSTKKENLAYFQAGVPYLDAVSALLTEAGIQTINRTETSSVLTEAREDWDIGTSNLKIANELLSEINYKQVWFDQYGAAVLEPSVIPSVDNIEHIFTGKKIDQRNPKEVGIISVFPEVARKTDIFSAPNVFVCVCSNADKSAGMVAIAENSNPQSPLSVQSRGRRITEVENVNNIASQAELEAYASRKASESLLTGEIINVTTQLQAGFGVGDVTALQYDDIMSICVENEWSMELKPGGKMTHVLEKVVLNIEG